jgi:trichohyalin
MFLILYF